MSSALRDPQDEQAMAGGLLSLVAVPRVKAGAEIDRSRLRKEELVLLDLVDGKRSVSNILQEGRLSGFVAMRILRSLYLRNILEPVDSTSPGGDQARGAAPAPVAAADTRHTRPLGVMDVQEVMKEVAASRSADTPPRDTAEPVADPERKPEQPERIIAVDPRSSRKLHEPTREGAIKVVPRAAAATWVAPAPDKQDPPDERETRGYADAPDDKAAGDKIPAAAAALEKKIAAAKAGDASEAVPQAHDEGESSSVRGTPRPFQVGPYEVAARIAQGGMGSIYVCRRRGPWGFERLFTLKVVRQHAAVAEEAVRSFLREAKLGAGLHHPNLLGVLDAGSFDGHPYLILDYVEGASLGELLAAAKPTPDVVVAVMLDLLRGLGAFHAHTARDGSPQNLVHGDVSPENVLVGLDGAARLGDFGSARPAGPTSETNGAVAKPSVMAPEQLCGDPIDQRTDLFSIGVTMWTALTGQKLFAESTYEKTVMNVLRKKVPPPSELGAPAALDDVCLKALSRSPEGRFATADEMRLALMKAASAAGLVATPTTVGAWVRRVIGDSIDDRRRRIERALAQVPAPRSHATPAPGSAASSASRGASHKKVSTVDTTMPPPAAAPRRRAVRPTIELRAATFTPARSHRRVPTVAEEEVPVMARSEKWRWMWVVTLLIALGAGALAWAAWRSAGAEPEATSTTP